MTKRKMLNKKLFPFSIYFFSILPFIYFILFPFGQLLRFEMQLFGNSVPFHGLDIVVGLSVLFLFIIRPPAHPLRKYFFAFVSIAFLTLLFASIRYPISEILRGSLYIVRFISYYAFFELIIHLIKSKKITKEKLLFILLSSLFVTGIFGWFQYAISPDLRYLKIFNWDDHYYRLTGTILDPGFMGILMVFGTLITLVHWIKLRQKRFVALSLFFFITLGFTYARAAYVALIVGIFILLFSFARSHLVRLKVFFIILFLSLTFLFVLPKGEGEGVNLLRTHSIFEKAKNYNETIQIISDYPVFGVGYNTLCSERMRRFPNQSFASHSCSGSDSSFLFILATTGVLGLFAFLQYSFSIMPLISKDMYGRIFIIVSSSLLVHSLFLNSLFYPWVLGIMAVLLAVALKK